MKTPTDPRHQQRQQTIKQLFAQGFSPQPRLNKQARAIMANQDRLDKLIKSCAPTWPIKKINRIDLAILRLAVFELVVEKSQPPKVIIDEAVELAKTYGSEKSSAFINGALGGLIKKEGIEINAQS